MIEHKVVLNTTFGGKMHKEIIEWEQTESKMKMKNSTFYLRKLKCLIINKYELR
jgi:hypothetical protein